MMKIKLLQDQREQDGWTFADYPDFEIQRTTLRFGDYTIAGLEHIIAIEKKADVEEIFHNLCPGDRERFLDAIYRLRSVPLSFLVIEATYQQICEGSFFSKMSPTVVMSFLNGLQMDGINVVFAGQGGGEHFVAELFRKVVKKYANEFNHP